MKYHTILADPPWPYHSPKAVVGNGGRGSANVEHIIQVDVERHYHTMSIQQMEELPIKDMCEDNAHLYLWTTNSFMVEAHDIARSWGFMPKTILTWVKTKNSEIVEPSMKTGYWYRSATEHIVFCVKGKLRLSGKATPTAFLLPRLPHSVKPDFFYDLIESQSPGPYLELFARRVRDGWSSWGDEIESNVILHENKTDAS